MTDTEKLAYLIGGIQGAIDYANGKALRSPCPDNAAYTEGYSLGYLMRKGFE